MAEAGRGSSGRVTIASPLYSEGVHHAEVTSPMWGNDPPDPLGYLPTSPSGGLQIKSSGSGDDVNDWKDTSFEGDDGDGV
jgi:hypothetical protein